MATKDDVQLALTLVQDNEVRAGVSIKSWRPYPCDICGAPRALVDGKTSKGVWAAMCAMCFSTYGIGLGIGRGQVLILELQET